MRRGGAGLIAAVLALAGCKSTGDPKPKDREPSGQAAARSKGKDATKDTAKQTWLDTVAKGPAAGTSVPKAGAWNDDPKSPNFDPKTAAQDAVGGKVVDAFGRPARNVFIRVEGVNDSPGAAARGILTNDGGYFFTRGLQPGQTYNLRAEASQEGKQLSGSVQTRVPNPILLITLREDQGTPGDPKQPAGGGGSLPPGDGNYIPPMGLGPAGGPSRPPRTDDGFSPETGSTRSLPPSIGGTPTPTTRPINPGDIPDPDDVSLPPGKPTRPENVADGVSRNPFTAPPASVPGPNVPNFPVPPATPPGGSPGPKQSRGPAPANFRLLDSLERYWDFASDRAGSVVLVEFVTTSCPHCKTAVPVLKELQSKYGAAGFQVVAVLCDELPRKERAAAAGKYARENNANYAVFVEPGASPGDVRDQFGVEAYPAAVLLDATGSVLWKGHPVRDKARLDAAIAKALGK